LIKAAVLEKETKLKQGTREKYQKKTDGGLGLGTFLEEQKAEADRAIQAENEEQQAELGSQQEGMFEANIARAKAVVEAENASAADPLFSLRAQAKAYELHKVNPRTLSS
jgi:DNA-binding protein H-NS